MSARKQTPNTSLNRTRNGVPRLGQNEMRPRRGTPLRVRFSEVLGHCDELAAAP